MKKNWSNWKEENAKKIKEIEDWIYSPEKLTDVYTDDGDLVFIFDDLRCFFGEGFRSKNFWKKYF